MSAFSANIIKWFNKNKRPLPWRDTKDAYLIWLSEIILQQTRVEQGMSYYLKFAETFPTVHHLAKANNDKVMKLWQGLGYYSRARNLHATAKIISEKHKGKFPETYSELLSLKGVGEYTASAIVSFAFNKPHAVVDGNVFRLLSRVYGIETPIDSTPGKKEFSVLANQLIDKKNPALYNQAIMEFGSMQCKPANPDCSLCPLNVMCFAFRKNRVNEFPVKATKTKTRNRYFNYLVFNNNENILIKKRTEKDIWINLFDFPMVETTTLWKEDELLSSHEWKRIIGKNKFVVKSISKIYKHILSHQIIYARFWDVDCKAFPSKSFGDVIAIKQSDIHKYAVPRLIEKYLKES